MIVEKLHQSALLKTFPDMIHSKNDFISDRLGEDYLKKKKKTGHEVNKQGVPVSTPAYWQRYHERDLIRELIICPSILMFQLD